MPQQDTTNYDVEQQLSKKIPKTVSIGPKRYEVKRTGTALKKVIELNPDVPEDEEEDPGDAAENIDRLYESLAALLVGPDGENPDPLQLQDELDYEIAQDLMEKFLPRRAEGKASRGSAPAPSTTT